MSKKVNKDLADLAVDYIQSNYDIKTVLEERGLLEGYESSGGNQIKILCFVHGEKTASLGVNLDTNVCHCLGCGAGGNIVSIINLYNKKVRNIYSNYYLTLESMVKADPAIQLKIGASSIYTNEVLNLDTIGSMKFRQSMKFNLIDSKPSTLLELSKKLKKKFPGRLDLILTSFALVDSGLSPSDIYDAIMRKEEITAEASEKPEKININLGSLIEDDQ